MSQFTLYPAIDLKDGACVRLRQGDMAQSTVFYDNPAEPAKDFANDGAQWLHLVDLNGAFEGKPVNIDAVKSIIDAVNIPIQLGGGIRDLTMIEKWLEAGISRVILGTVAVKNPDMVTEACRAFKGKVAAGIDAKDGMVALEGWAEASHVPAIDLARRMEDAGVCAIIYTDIAKDGMMQGPNIEETANLAKAIHVPIIASGGISNLADVTALAAYRDDGIAGAISGRALYDGRLDLSAAIKATQ